MHNVLGDLMLVVVVVMKWLVMMVIFVVTILGIGNLQLAPWQAYSSEQQQDTVLL